MTDERIVYLHDFDGNENPTDVKVSIRRTIGQFVGNQSQKSGQRYALDSDGIQEISGKGLHIEDNKVTPPLTKFDGQHQGGSYTAFEEAAGFVNGAQLISKQNTISNYGELDDVSLVKGKEASPGTDSAITFSELLNDVNIPEGRVASAVSRNLLDASGFDNSHKVGDSIKTAPIPIQSEIGRYEKYQQRFQLELEEYKNIGIKMLLEGSGEFIRVVDPKSDAQRAAFLAASPLGSARLGAKVPYINVNANSIVKREHPEYKKETTSQYFGNPGYVSGAPYNPLIVFEGFSNEAQTATCYLMFTSIFATISTIAATYEALHNRQEARKTNRNTASRRIGFSRLFGQTSIQNGSDNFFGLIETKNDYTTCVRKGLRAFFGFGADGNLANSRLFINNPGYSSVILRMVISDALNVFGNSVLGGLIPNGIPSNTQAPSTVTEGLAQSSETLNKLRNSKMLKFMNVVAHLGDIIVELNSQDVTADLYFGDNSDVQIIPTDQIIALNNENVDSLQLRKAITNNRLKEDKGFLLSWGNKTTPNFISYTDTFTKARNKFIGTINAETNNAFVEAMKYNSITPISGNKLRAEDVKKVEGQLGYAYLPFYFHDLRTNEIISFHGFLSDLSDQFSTDYEASEGYGRAGSLYHYKNVKRKTGLRFWMVATNKEDFDLMWYKLNRLLAMAQPMYTEGRSISYTDNSNQYKFTQPFSQIPAGTPIVRVRVGDIITNNVSDLDIARLYGLGNNSLFSLSHQSEQVAPLTTQVESIREQIRGFENKFQVGKQLVSHTRLYASRPTRNGINGEILTTPPNRGGRNNFVIDAGSKITITQVPTAQNGSGTVAVTLEGGDQTNYNIDRQIISSCFNLTQDDISAVREANPRLETSSNSLQEAQRNATIFNEQEELNFLKGTPIFKSFESAAGEGMLAVIESIEPAFDMSSMAWEDEPGSVAPKAFEVAISLAPMFDINPGIAADGQMIGAIYRVGRINHGMKALKYKNDQITQRNISPEGTNSTSGTPPGANR